MAKSVIIDSVCETRLTLLDGPQAGAGIAIAPGVTPLSSDQGGLSVVGAERAEGAIIRDALTPFLGPLLEQGGARRRLGRRGVVELGALHAEIATSTTAGARVAFGGALAATLGVLIALSPMLGLVDRPVAMATGRLESAPSQRQAEAEAEAALAWLVEALRAAGLQDKIAARRGREEATLIADGVIAPEDLPAWRGVLAALDAQASPVFLIKAVQVEARSVVVPFTVVGLSADRGALRLADGKRFEVGDTLPGGWILEAIDADGAAIRRGADLIRLSL